MVTTNMTMSYQQQFKYILQSNLFLHNLKRLNISILPSIFGMQLSIIKMFFFYIKLYRKTIED